MSPLLFLVVIDEIPCNCIDEQSRRGILWHPIKMEHLEVLDLADDIAMLATPHSDMHSKIDDVNASRSQDQLRQDQSNGNKRCSPSQFCSRWPTNRKCICLYSVCECERQPKITIPVQTFHTKVVGSRVKAKMAIEFFPYTPMRRM